jgi:hypothetical protein
MERIRAHWGRFASKLAATGDDYDLADLVKQQVAATDDAWEIARVEAHTTLPKILTPTQLKILPGNSSTMYNAKEPIKGIRYFSTLSC